MASPEIYLYSHCSSCKKAEAAFKEADVALIRRDIFKDRLSPSEITALLDRIGRSAFDVLSTRSIPYRELDLANRPVTEKELVGLMSEHPGLLKRPIIVAGDRNYVGFNKMAIEELIAQLK